MPLLRKECRHMLLTFRFLPTVSNNVPGEDIKSDQVNSWSISSVVVWGRCICKMKVDTHTFVSVYWCTPGMGECCLLVFGVIQNMITA